VDFLLRLDFLLDEPDGVWVSAKAEGFPGSLPSKSVCPSLATRLAVSMTYSCPDMVAVLPLRARGFWITGVWAGAGVAAGVGSGPLWRLERRAPPNVCWFADPGELFGARRFLDEG
jgi:hypothetical protein